MVTKREVLERVAERTRDGKATTYRNLPWWLDLTEDAACDHLRRLWQQRLIECMGERRLGFKVIYVAEADVGKMRLALAQFDAVLRANPHALALFYFAGHGVNVDGANYLLPVGEPIDTRVKARALGTRDKDVLDLMKDAGAGIKIVVLDACRNAPFQAQERAAVCAARLVQGEDDDKHYCFFAKADQGTARAPEFVPDPPPNLGFEQTKRPCSHWANPAFCCRRAFGTRSFS